MKKQKAVEILKRQIDLIENLKYKQRFSSDYKKWRRDTEVAIEHIFGKEGRHLTDFRDINFLGGVIGATDNQCDRAFRKGLANAREVLKSMIDEIMEWGIDQSDGPSLNTISIIENLCKKFHLVARQIKSRHDNRQTLLVEDEYDVQDLLHALLTLHFDDIRPEEWTPSYAGGCSRMDFLLKQEQVVIEVKKTRRTLGAKEIGEQLIVDIDKYKEHRDCKTLLCFVYDPETWIPNPRGIENDLNRLNGEPKVTVLIAPSGL